MSKYAAPGATIEASTDPTGLTGLVGTIGVRITDGQGNTTVARDTTGIIEEPAGSTIYTKTDLVAPSTQGSYKIVFDTGGGTPLYFLEELEVTFTPPPGAPAPNDGAAFLMARLDAELERSNTLSDFTLDEKTQALRDAISAFEREAGRVFFERDRSETFLTREFDSVLRLPIVYSETLTLTTITGPDGAIDLSEVTNQGRRLYRTDGWAAGTWSVEFTHGPPYPEDFVARAMVLIASAILADGPYDDRGFAVQGDGGFIRMLTAGVAGAAFSIPDVEAALKRVEIKLVGGP